MAANLIEIETDELIEELERRSDALAVLMIESIETEDRQMRQRVYGDRLAIYGLIGTAWDKIRKELADGVE